MGNRILVVDDEKEIADVIELYLKNEGFEVEKFYTGKDALVSIEKAAPDMALLDVMLPDIDGFEVLQKIREKYNFPVIMLTAKTEYMDKINGLMLGADDYMAKPFNPLELIARVKAQMRRFTKYNTGGRAQEDVIDFGKTVLGEIEDRFAKIDEVAEINQLKVIHAMQENRVSEGCFNYVSGYGYNDQGRDTLEDVYASVFHTDAALVRPQITCGTHALALALAANLRPGDTLLSPVGKPYDTLE